MPGAAGSERNSAEERPRDLERIASLILNSGLLRGSRFFSADHHVGDEEDRREQITIKFASYRGSHAHLSFLIWEDGEIELYAVPNRTPRGDYRNESVFQARFPRRTESTFQILEKLVDVLRRTIELYETSEPWKDYATVLEVWRDYSPVLSEEQQPTSPFPPWWELQKRPWWKFW